MSTTVVSVPFYRHSIEEEDIEATCATLRSGFLTAGPRTSEFESSLADYLGARYALGFTNCTTATFLILKAWGIGPGDEVIVPAMTFMSTANVVLHCGARPVFVDVEECTGNIDVAQVCAAVNDRTKAIIPVHMYGQMADMKRLRELSDQHGLKLLEDAAHALESIRDGIRPGQIGDAAAFSFYATKNITCGEGGATATNNLDLQEKLRLLRTHGMSKTAADRHTGGRYQHWDMLALGYKANMGDIQASLLKGQLRRADKNLARRQEICKFYEESFRACGLEFPRVLPGSRSARHLFTLWTSAQKRDATLDYLQNHGIGVTVNYRPVHLLAYYRQTFGYRPGSLPVAERIGDRTISLPLYPQLSDLEVEYVASTVVASTRVL